MARFANPILNFAFVILVLGFSAVEANQECHGFITVAMLKKGCPQAIIFILIVIGALIGMSRNFTRFRLNVDLL